MRAAILVAMTWAVLKGTDEDTTALVLRIVPAGESFAAVRIEAVGRIGRMG